MFFLSAGKLTIFFQTAKKASKLKEENYEKLSLGVIVTSKKRR
jgi:hypothetical protein